VDGGIAITRAGASKIGSWRGARAAEEGATVAKGAETIAETTGATGEIASGSTKYSELFSPKGVGAIEKANPELLNAVEQHGRTIKIAEEGSEEMRYLDYMNAEANVGGPTNSHILLRPNPTKVAVLEEFLHGTQTRLGIIEKLGVGRAEVHDLC
jgi:hypothetical protein